MSAEPIVRVRGVHKYFTRGSEQIDVLKDLHLEVAEGEFLGLMGPSGSGKTTLLNLIAGLDTPSEGEVWIGDDLISGMSEGQLARWRTRNIGFIFQFYHLLPVLTAYENVELPLDARPACGPAGPAHPAPGEGPARDHRPARGGNGHSAQIGRAPGRRPGHGHPRPGIDILPGGRADGEPDLRMVPQLFGVR